ncbi:MAG: DUF547 domain-containing protein [Hyphomonadaceae bacterium]
MIRHILTGVAALALSLTPAPPVANADTMSELSIETPGQHSAWSQLLGSYVEAIDGRVNCFNYAALKASTTDTEALNAYINAIAGSDFSSLNDDEAFAAWANLYNALTVQLIVQNYPVTSIKQIKPSLFASGPWKQDIVTVGGRELSLDDIEHGILRSDWDEPRVHYALNCASYGCPNLRAVAWEASTLDEDLTSAARDYINHPRGVSIRHDGRLELSAIYKWFREDFGGNDSGVIEHLLTYASADLAADIRANPKIASHDYDWSLNSTD